MPLHKIVKLEKFDPFRLQEDFEKGLINNAIIYYHSDEKHRGHIDLIINGAIQYKLYDPDPNNPPILRMSPGERKRVKGLDDILDLYSSIEW